MYRKKLISGLLSLIVCLFGMHLSANNHSTAQEKKHGQGNRQLLPKWLELETKFEYGFSFFFNNDIQWGKGANASLDYVNNGGESVLFPNWRISAGATFFKDHQFTFVYQPIYVDTRVVLRKDFSPDGVTFKKGDAVNMAYYFPFYRASYLYHAINGQNWRYSVGLGLQLRNARIIYTSADGTKRFEKRNVGPVPLLHTALRYTFENRLYLNLDLQGFWAPIKFFNGSNTDSEGGIYELTLESGGQINNLLGFFANMRLLGGGNQGTSKKPRPTGGRYSKNTINNLSFNLGISLNF
jgi:hypothetical protein